MTKKHALAVLAYVIATFATQAVSHFAVNADHYASVAHLRKEPIFPLGILSMLIQGSLLSWLYSRMIGSGRSIGHALWFAWAAGGVLVSYISLAEAAKYAVPASSSWITVEAVAGAVQFTVYGLLLGLTYRHRAAS